MLAVTREQIKLVYINIVLEILDQRVNLLKYFTILGKIYLWNCRKNQEKIEIEKLIVSQSILNFKHFQAKWSPVLNNNPVFFFL